MSDFFNKQIISKICFIKDSNMNDQNNISINQITKVTNFMKKKNTSMSLCEYENMISCKLYHNNSEENYIQKNKVESSNNDNGDGEKKTKHLYTSKNTQNNYNIKNISIFSNYSKGYGSDSKIYTCKKSTGFGKKKKKKYIMQNNVQNNVQNNMQNENILDKTITTNSILSEYENCQNNFVKKSNNENVSYDSSDTHDFNQNSKNKLDNVMYKKKMKQVNKILYNLNYFTQFKSLNLKSSMKKKPHTKIYIKKNTAKGQDIHNNNKDSSNFVTLNEFSKFKITNDILENNNNKSIVEQVKDNKIPNDNFTDIKNNTEHTNISKNAYAHNEYDLNGHQNNKQNQYSNNNNNNTCEDSTFWEKWNDNYYKSETANSTNIPKKKIHNDKYFKSLLHIGLKDLLNKKRQKKKKANNNYENIQNIIDNENEPTQNTEEINLTIQKNISNVHNHNDIINNHKKHDTNNDNTLIYNSTENATCQNKIINCSEKNHNVNKIMAKCFLSNHNISPSNNFISPPHKNYKYHLINSIKNALDTNQKKQMDSTNMNENSFNSLHLPTSNNSYTQNVKNQFPQTEKLYNSNDQHNDINSNSTENENFLANNKEDLFFSEQKENIPHNLIHPINSSNIQQNDEANNNIVKRKKRRRRRKQKKRKEKKNKFEEILEQKKENNSHEMNKIASLAINLPGHGKVKKKNIQLTNFEKVNNEHFSKKNKQSQKNEYTIMCKDEFINLKTNKFGTYSNSNNESTIIELFQVQKNEASKCTDKNNRSNSNPNSQKKKKKNIQRNKKKNTQNNTAPITSINIQRNTDRKDGNFHEGYPQHINNYENNFIIPNPNFSPDYLYNNYLNNIFCVQNYNRKYLSDQNEVAMEKQKINLPYYNHNLGSNYYINNIIPMPISSIAQTHALRNYQNYDSSFNNIINTNNLYYLDRWGNQISLNSQNALLYNYSKKFYNNTNQILKNQILNSTDFTNYSLYDRQSSDKYYLTPFNSRENYKIQENFYCDFNPIINDSFRHINDINNVDSNSNLNKHFNNIYNYGHQNAATKSEKKKKKLSKKYKKKKFQELPFHFTNFINSEIKNKSGNKNQCSYICDPNNKNYDDISNTNQNQSKCSCISNYNTSPLSKQYNDMLITHKESNDSFLNFENMKNCDNNNPLTQWTSPFPYTNNVLYPNNFIYNNNIVNNRYNYNISPHLATLHQHMNFFQNKNINLHHSFCNKHIKHNEDSDLEKNKNNSKVETQNVDSYEIIKKDHSKINEKNKPLDNNTPKDIFNYIEKQFRVSNLSNKLRSYSNHILNKNIKKMHDICIDKIRSISLIYEKKSNKIKNIPRSISIIPVNNKKNSFINKINNNNNLSNNCIINKINPYISPFNVSMENHDKLFIFNLLRTTENNLVNILNFVKPTKDIILTKKLFFLSLLKLVKQLFHYNIHIYIVGSSAYGIDSKSSDLDIVIQTNNYSNKFILHTLYNSINKIKQGKYNTNKNNISSEYLYNNNNAEENIYIFFKDVEMQLIDSARVPILTIKKNNVACDLSVNTNNSIKHTEFFLNILKYYPNLKNVMKLLKLLLKNRTIPSMKQGGLPTILWMMLSIRYCKFPENKISSHTNKHPFYYSEHTISEQNYDINKSNHCENNSYQYFDQTIDPISFNDNFSDLLLYSQKYLKNKKLNQEEKKTCIFPPNECSNSITNQIPTIHSHISNKINTEGNVQTYTQINKQIIHTNSNTDTKDTPSIRDSSLSNLKKKKKKKNDKISYNTLSEKFLSLSYNYVHKFFSKNSNNSRNNNKHENAKVRNNIKFKNDGKNRNNKINSLKILHKNSKKIAKYQNIINSKKKKKKKLPLTNYLNGFQHNIEEIHEEYFLYASPLLYSLFIFYNALNSRTKLMKIINIIDEDRCYKKNIYETNKKLLSPACHGGVWDDLLTLYDPIYSFNYDIFFNKSANLCPDLMHSNPNGPSYRLRARSTVGAQTGNTNQRKNETDFELKDSHRLNISLSKNVIYQTKENKNNDQIRSLQRNLSKFSNQYLGRSSSQTLRKSGNDRPELYHNLNEQIKNKKNDIKQNIIFQSNLNNENIRNAQFEKNKLLNNWDNLHYYNSLDKNNESEISTINEDLENNSINKTNLNNYDTYFIENYNNQYDLKCENSSYIQKQYNEKLCTPLKECSDQIGNSNQNKPEQARNMPEMINNVHTNNCQNECNLDELIWSQNYNSKYNRSSQIWSNYKNNAFEKLYEHNIDLSSKVSSATWLIYLYELKRASFFINYYIHHMHMLMSFKKLLKDFEQNCDKNLQKKYDQNFGLFQNNKWVVLKREDIWKEDGETAKLVSPQKKYNFENHIILNNGNDNDNNYDYGHAKLKEIPKYSEQDRKNISNEIICSQDFDENISKQKHIKKLKRQKKSVELIKNMKQILKSIIQNLNYSIISLFEKTKGDIYTLPFHLNSEKNTKNNENEKYAELNIYPSTNPPENEPALDNDLSNYSTKNYKKIHDNNILNNNNYDTVINAFGLVLIEGKLIFVKFLNVCIDKQNFWNELFLCRRDIKTVMHVKPMDVIFVSNKKKKYLDASKARSTKITEFNSKHRIIEEMNQNNNKPIYFSQKNNKSDRKIENNLNPNVPSTNLFETDKPITNENIYHQVVSEKTPSEPIYDESNAKKNKKNRTTSSSVNHDKIYYENNVLGEDKSISSKYETYNYNNTQHPPDAYSKHTLKTYKQSKNDKNGKENEETDNEAGESAGTEQIIKDKIKNWDFKKQKRIHKSSNFIYNAKNNYIGILINQHKYRNDIFAKYTNTETGSDKGNIIIQKKCQTCKNDDSYKCTNMCQDSTKDNVLLVNPCNFVTRINVKTIYVSSKHIINKDLKNAIFEKTNFKENNINENLKKKQKKINSNNIQHNEQTNDDIYSIQIIPRCEIMRYKELIKIMKNSPYYYKVAKNISNTTKTPLQQPVPICNFCSTKGTFNINTNHFMFSNIYEDARTELATIISGIITKQKNKNKKIKIKNLSMNNNKTETLNS
ncbi:erythrocyte membrane-associated antigen, putative [Plasmodium berghei]|uniref:Erythrocyte membrane-associated antigen, putative n=1 Tax=Plasmodium berghei TaxID=5821 RepID=A0A1D3PWY5_PLABE|nr:erythrocyte membrane-associated antigen, putative [Plasmodium berghei]